jgi:hypothetical protein
MDNDAEQYKRIINAFDKEFMKEMYTESKSAWTREDAARDVERMRQQNEETRKRYAQIVSEFHKSQMEQDLPFSDPEVDEDA